MTKKEKIKQLLLLLERSLRDAELWSTEEIAEDRLASKVPFCADTLSYPEWLQFVFIRKMQALIEGEDDLPSASGLFPMAQVYFGRDIFRYRELAGILLKLDRTIREEISG
ncbi:MAG: YqcC family protein [Proteobacteria bacterium]|nr:YqcC family protein [Pseudomonadota bacterium]